MNAEPGRYTSRALPAYAHRPGRTAHPVTDPAGHSFGASHAIDPAAVRMAGLLPAGWRECEGYLYGCDLFNLGYWWEAHEAWEGLWRARPEGDPSGLLLRGLIQVAAAALKLDEGELAGAGRALERAEKNLRAAGGGAMPERALGLGVRAWWGEVSAWAARGEKAPPPAIVLGGEGEEGTEG